MLIGSTRVIFRMFPPPLLPPVCIPHHIAIVPSVASGSVPTLGWPLSSDQGPPRPGGQLQLLAPLTIYCDFDQKNQGQKQWPLYRVWAVVPLSCHQRA